MHTHPDGDLERITNHVKYEVDLYREGIQDWVCLQANMDDKNFLYAVEDALIHYRVLCEFFLCGTAKEKPPQHDDVVAAHYVADWDLTGDMNDHKCFLRETRERINKTLAHVTLHRLRTSEGTKWNPGDGWQVRKMCDVMESVIGHFKQRLVGNNAVWFSWLDECKPQWICVDVGQTVSGTPSGLPYHLSNSRNEERVLFVRSNKSGTSDL